MGMSKREMDRRRKGEMERGKEGGREEGKGGRGGRRGKGRREGEEMERGKETGREKEEKGREEGKGLQRPQFAEWLRLLTSCGRSGLNWSVAKSSYPGASLTLICSMTTSKCFSTTHITSSVVYELSPPPPSLSRTVHTVELGSKLCSTLGGQCSLHQTHSQVSPFILCATKKSLG